MTQGNNTDKAAIDHVVGSFFSAFDNQKRNLVALERLTEIFVPGCVIVKTCGNTPSIYGFHDFIAPRQELLNGGGLEDFSEQETWEKTDIFGSLAQRLCAYRKSGVLRGEKFDVKGMKSIQLVRSDNGWRIASVIWDDERDGVVVPSHPAMLALA